MLQIVRISLDQAIYHSANSRFGLFSSHPNKVITFGWPSRWTQLLLWLNFQSDRIQIIQARMFARKYDNSFSSRVPSHYRFGVVLSVVSLWNGFNLTAFHQKITVNSHSSDFFTKWRSVLGCYIISSLTLTQLALVPILRRESCTIG